MNAISRPPKTLSAFLSETLAHLLILALFAAPFFYTFELPTVPIANAVGIYGADDLLGILDEDGDPVFTLSSVANNLGFSPGGLFSDVEIDTTDHRLFVNDQNNHRILVFNLDANNELVDRSADFVLGQSNFYETTSGTTQGKLNAPGAMAYDSLNDRLFVIDRSNTRIMVFDVASITNGENAVNVLGQTDFVSTATGTTQSRFAFSGFGISGITLDVDGQRLFVGDADNNRIMVFDVASITNGENAVNVLGQTDFVTGTAGATQSKIGRIFGLEYNAPDDHLFASDADNHRVMVFDVASITNGENAINVLGQDDFTSVGGATTQDGMQGPVALSYDATADRLFVGDRLNNRVMVFDVASITDGENAVNVLGQTDFVTSGAPSTTQGSTGEPTGAAFNGGDQLFVFDDGAARVMVFDVASITNGENAIDLLGQLDESNSPVYTTSGANNTPNNKQFDGPEATAVDTINHRLFVSDRGNNRVLVFTLDSNNELADRNADFVLGASDFKTVAGGTTQATLQTPRGMLYDATNSRLFVADAGNHRVMVFDVASITNGENAVNVLGQTDFVSNTGATTQNGLSQPFGMAYDTTNSRLFVSEYDNHRVMVFDVASITNGENAVNVLGQEDFVTQTGMTTQDGMQGPVGLAYDSSNQRLFVTDGENSRVLVFDVASITNGENAINVLGAPNFTDNGSGTLQNDFNNGQGLAYDSNQQTLFVGGNNDNRIMVFDVASITDGENAVNVIGQDDFTDDASGTTQQDLSSPAALGYDPALNRLYVADSSNQRVMIFDLVRITTTSLPAGVLGTPYSQGISTTDSQGTVTTAVTSGSLPTGLSLGSGTISGTPTVAGTYNFTIRATDTLSTGTFVDDQSYSVTISAGGGGNNNNNPAPTAAPAPTPTPSPSASLIVDGNAVSTSDRNVILTLGLHNLNPPSQNVTVQISNHADFSVAVSRSFATSIPWDICFSETVCAPGTHTVYTRFSLSQPQTTLTAMDTINLLAPTPTPSGPPTASLPNIVINKNADTTTSPLVQLQLTQPFGSAASTSVLMQISNRSDFGAATWRPYAAVVNDWNICRRTNGVCPSGQYTVYARFRNPIAAITSESVFDVIQYDSSLNVPSVDINAGAVSTSTPNVLLHIHQPFPVAANVTMRVANEPTFQGVQRIPYSDTMIWDLCFNVSCSKGPKTVYVDFFDGSGYAVGPVSTTINYSYFTPFVPSNGISILEKPVTRDRSVTIRMNGYYFDYNVQLSNSVDFAQSVPSGYIYEVPWDICRNLASCIAGDHTVYALFKTEAGSSSFVFDSIAYNPLATPTPSPSPTRTPTPLPSATPRITPVRTPLLTPTPSGTPQAEVTPEPGGEGGVVATPTPQGTPVPPPEGSRGFVESVSDAIFEAEPIPIPSAVREQAQDIISRIPGSDVTVITAIAAGNTVILSSVASLLSGFIHSFAGIFEFLKYLFISFASVLLVKGRPKPWGVVYDSLTKRPVPFAKIQLLDESGRVLETRITDQDGRYGFLAGAKMSGNTRLMVRLQVSKHGYVFPSKVAPAASDAVSYGPPYLGDMVSIAPEEVVKFNIPVDQEPAAALPTGKMSHWNAGRALARFSNVGFFVALGSVPLQYLAFPTTLNLIMVGIVLGAVVLRSSGIWVRPFGVIVDSTTSMPMPFALITLTDLNGQRVGFTVSDQQGRYILPSPKGSHILEVFTPAHVTPPRNGRAQLESKGWITSKLSV